MKFVGASIFFSPLGHRFRRLSNIFKPPVSVSQRHTAEGPRRERTAGGGGHWTLAPFWNIYGFTTIFAVLGLLLLGYFVVRRREPEKVFLLVWTAIILLAALAQRRFNYYLVVNIAYIVG